MVRRVDSALLLLVLLTVFPILVSSVSLAYDDLCSVPQIGTDLNSPLFFGALDKDVTIDGIPSTSYSLEVYPSQAGKGYLYKIVFSAGGTATIQDKVAKCTTTITASNIEATRTAQQTQTKLQELTQKNAQLESKIENELNPLKVQFAELQINNTRLKAIVDQNQTIRQPMFADETSMIRGISQISFADMVQIKWAATLALILSCFFARWYLKQDKLHEGCTRG